MIHLICVMMLKRITNALIILFLAYGFYVPSSASAQAISQTLIVTSETPWLAVEKGVELKKMSLDRDLSPIDMQVTLLRFNMKYIDVSVGITKEMGIPNSSVVEILKRKGGFCGINGGYFDTSGKPLGLLVSGGRKIGRIRTNSLIFSGIFFCKGGAYFIKHRSVFPKKSVSLAIQAGPRLIVDGRRASGAEAVGSFWLPDIRSIIAIDAKNNIVLFIVNSPSPLNGLTLFESQEILLKYNIKYALNLDGGRSSQLVLHSKHKNIVIGSNSSVPVALCFSRHVK